MSFCFMSFLILRLFILKYHISLGIVNCPQDEDICITIKIQTMHSFLRPKPVPLSYTSLATGTSSAFLHFPGDRNQFRFSTFLATGTSSAFPLSWQPEPVPLFYFPGTTGTSSAFLHFSGDRNQFRFPTLPWQPEPVPLSYTSLATGTSSAFPLSWQPEPVPLHSDHHKNRPKMALSSSSMAPKCRTASLPLSPTGLRYESEMH